MVLILTAALSIAGGILMKLTVPDISFHKKNQSLHFKGVFDAFSNKPFRSAAIGYFGHMWELYTFWAFAPVMLLTYKNLHTGSTLHISFWAFWIIALGGLACVGSGYLSQRFGAKRTAFAALFLSGCCCLLSPLAFYLPPAAFIAFLIFWGLVVIADSPLFSTLVAQNVPAHIKGTALTLVTCIGFSITIVSIELLNYLNRHTNTQFIYLLLAVGPFTGILHMFVKDRNPI
jgi:MFS family permease